MHVVPDTDVLVPGVARASGAPGRVIQAWRDGQFDLVVSEALLEEAARAVFADKAYPKVRTLLDKSGITTAMTTEFLEILRFKTITVASEGVAVPVMLADADDLHVVQAFIASGAEFLVTGDKRDLLSLALPGVMGVSVFEHKLSALRFE